MLSTDEIIINILLNAKKDGHELLKHFKIGFPRREATVICLAIFSCVIANIIHRHYLKSSKDNEYFTGFSIAHLLGKVKKNCHNTKIVYNIRE